MSSKKIPMKFYIVDELREKFLKEADGRRPSLMMDRVLRERYKLPGGEQGDKEHAKQ